MNPGYSKAHSKTAGVAWLLGWLALGCLVTPALARQLDPNNPRDAVTIARKIDCSTEDGEQTTYWWHGKAYSRRQGERDRLLFLVDGMNIRACVSDNDPQRGQGYRLVSRELLIYRDPETGEALKTWTNPFTGEEVEVLHVANDPVNFSFYERLPDGSPLKWEGEISDGQWRRTRVTPLFYPNPLGGSYQQEVGAIYHAVEMSNFMGVAEELLDSQQTATEEVYVGWTRASQWLPWMKMQGREGMIYMHTGGLRLPSFEALPQRMKDEIDRHYPEYRQPPPLDDRRPNVTSWKYYKRVKEGTEVPPQR